MGNYGRNGKKLQGPTKTPTGKTGAPFLWGASIVELSLNHTILLWEQRNNDVHGSTAQEENQKLVQRHRNTIRELLLLQSRTCPREAYIFQNPEELLSNEDAKILGNWIATRGPAIQASIKHVSRNAIENTPGILQWFHPIATIPPQNNWTRDQLRNDPFSKKKRQKTTSQDYHPTLKHFLTLHNAP